MGRRSFQVNPANMKIIIEFDDKRIVFDKILNYKIDSDVTIGFNDFPKMEVELNFALNWEGYSIEEVGSDV